MPLVLCQMAGSMLLKKKKGKPRHQGQETEAHIRAITAMASKTFATSLAPQSWREQVQHRTREHLQLGKYQWWVQTFHSFSFTWQYRKLKQAQFELQTDTHIFLDWIFSLYISVYFYKKNVFKNSLLAIVT